MLPGPLCPVFKLQIKKDQYGDEQKQINFYHHKVSVVFLDPVPANIGVCLNIF